MDITGSGRSAMIPEAHEAAGVCTECGPSGLMGDARAEPNIATEILVKQKIVSRMHIFWIIGDYRRSDRAQIEVERFSGGTQVL